MFLTHSDRQSVVSGGSGEPLTFNFTQNESSMKAAPAPSYSQAYMSRSSPVAAPISKFSPSFLKEVYRPTASNVSAIYSIS